MGIANAQDVGRTALTIPRSTARAAATVRAKNATTKTE